MTASAFEQDWYLFFQPFSTLYINQAYSEWNIIIHTGLHMIAQLSNSHDGVILLPTMVRILLVFPFLFNFGHPSEV